MGTVHGRWVIALTGASGMRYALRLLDVASQHLAELHVIISEAALRVLREEENLKISYSNVSTELLFGREARNVFFYNPRDIGAKVASGSALLDGMVVVPCSMGTLAAIANGMSENLVHRAADVTMKEGRRLVIVPRETPLSAIHLENMLKLTRFGVRVVPAMPGFYHRPRNLEEVIDMMVMKILDQMGVHIDLVSRWKEAQQDPAPQRVVLGFKKFSDEESKG
ncbi:MAG: UbiX family flavin prenyltransferase [Deltaproteobacteria bacterium]|nr:UbiX family flavin prenyltransferase [Deltaproteobacteria bacterium]